MYSLQGGSETVDHIFNEYPVTKALYDTTIAAGTNLVLNTTGILVRLTELLTQVVVHYKKSRSILLISQFVLWREGGAKIFRDSNKDVQELVGEVLAQLKFTEMSAFH